MESNYFIDEKNIKNFVENKTKFLFTDTNYKDYTKEHLINSIHFPSACLRTSGFVQSNICKSNGIIPVQYIDDNCLMQLFRNCGLSRKDHICVYGGQDEDVYACIFVLYTLYKFGFNNIYYLNCDWKNLPKKYFTQEFPEWKHNAGEKFIVRDLSFSPDDVYSLILSEKIKFLDVRSPSDYSGETGVWLVKGHIPGAYNIFWKDLFVKVENDKKELIPSQKFIKFSEIKKKFEKFLNPNDNICVYCNTGSEGTIGIFVMKFLFGWKKAKLFEKSYGSYQYLHQICPDLYPIVKNN